MTGDRDGEATLPPPRPILEAVRLHVEATTVSDQQHWKSLQKWLLDRIAAAEKTHADRLSDEYSFGFAAGERSGIEKAAKWHDDQIAIIEKQVAANNQYLKRHSGAMRAIVAANDSCSRHQTAHRLSATAIRALTGDPQT